MDQASNSAIRAAVANAFLYRCGGYADLALGYLKESLRLSARVSGHAPLAPPPRGTGERFVDWLDAAREAGIETKAHEELRLACERLSAEPPPLEDPSVFTIAAPEENLARASLSASQVVLKLTSEGAAAAGCYFALLLFPANDFAHYNLGVHFMKKREWELAALHLEAVLAIDPTAADALNAMHNVATKTNGMARVAPYLENLLRLRERAAPLTASPTEGPPVMERIPGAGASIGELALARGTALIRGAVQIDACRELAALAAEWFDSHHPRLSWDLAQSQPRYRDPLVLLTPEMLAALEMIFGRTPKVLGFNTYVRRVLPTQESSHIPFHQDVTALAVACVNVWVPLVPCGVDAPSLEIMAARTDKIFPTVSSAGDYNQTEITAAVVYEAFPPELRFYPKPEVGDAVVLLGGTIHRSHIAPGMTRARMSVEMRFH